MHVSAEQEKVEFKPATLTVVFHTAKELAVFTRMMQYTSSIPAKMTEWDNQSPEEEELLSQVMKDVFYCLTPLQGKRVKVNKCFSKLKEKM